MKREIPAEFRPHLEEGSAAAEEGSGITLRGMLVGGALCAFIGVWVPHTSMVLQGTPMGFSSATPAAFFLLFVLLLGLHVLLGACRKTWAFQRGELITVTIMMMVASAIPTRGVTGMLLPMITGTFYYATPENEWATRIHPFLARWMVVDDPAAVRGFYEGSSPPVIPWEAWLSPLLGWLVFYAGFYLALISLMVILRRQWAEHERLVYPIAQVPLAMIQEGDGLVKPFFKNWIMWGGFALPFGIYSLNALHHYFPAIGTLELVAQLAVFRDLGLTFRINFLILGFSYLINSTISLSLWFFYLLFQVEAGVLNTLGLRSTEDLGPWSQPGPGHQMMGALIVLVFWGLWTGRDHLKSVVRQALHKDAAVDDAAEILSYRGAVLGSLAGSATMGVWLWCSGFPAWIAPLFVFAALVILVGLARMVAEAGLPTVVPAMVPPGFVISAVGVPALGVKGMIATGYTLVWVAELLVFMTAPLANGLRLANETSGDRRRLFWAIALAMLITLVVSVWFTLHLAYRDGGVNLHSQFFSSFARDPSEFAARKLTHPSDPSLGGYLWTLSGGLVMGLLMVARQRLSWWPFHPLGYAACMGWVMNHMWFPIFLAWLIKVLILKYGGAGVYQQTRPFFLGLVLGHFTVGGVWLFIDSYTGMVGNSISVLY